MKSIVDDENDFENQQNLYSDNIYFDGETDSTLVFYDKKESNRLEMEANRLLKEEEIILENYIINPERLKTNKQKDCLAYLNKNLDKSYQIFCKPFFGSDNPDFVVLKEGKKVLLIEVCENDNNEYSEKIAKTYKNNITKIYIPELVESFEGNNKGWYLIKAVVWHNNDLQKGDFYKSLNETINPSYSNNKNNFRLNSHLNKKLLEFLEEKYFLVDQSSRYKNIPQWSDLTSSQKRLSESEKGKQQKIKGVAGSGKTIVLAKRAVNAHKRTKKRVLILVYNTSIIPHIQKIIAEILGGTFNNFDFCIQNYDGFISSQLRNNSIQFDLKNNNNEKFFENLKIDFKKYESIFIDEIQDYSQEWISIIRNNFLEKNGEFVVFGDEKQGIYKGEELNICPEIKKWSNLSDNKTFRLPPQISKLATKFQDYFLKNGYSEVEEISSQEAMFNGEISYFEFQGNESIEILNNKILEIVNTEDKNTVVLSSGEDLLKTINSSLKAKKVKTLTTFFSSEFEKKLSLNNQKEAFLGDKKRSLRSKFSMNTEAIKLSTTYSFKGYEADTVIIIIQSWEQNNELLYTALTRAKESLIILNLGNNKYEKFFQKNSKLLIEKPFKFQIYEIQEENILLKEKISDIDRNKSLLSLSIKKLEQDNEKLTQWKSVSVDRINILEKEISDLEKEVFKKDSDELVELTERIEKLKKEKKEIKKEFARQEREIEKLNKNFYKNLKEERLYFEKELSKERLELKNDFDEKISLKEQECLERIKQISIGNNSNKNSITASESNPNISYQKLLNYLADNKKFKIAILGNVTDKNELKKELGNYFLKCSVQPSDWDIEFFTNKKLKEISFTQFKKGSSSFNLLITGNIAKHSSKGNSCANILTELEKGDYVDYKIPSSPKKKLTINNFIESIQGYLNEKVSRIN